MIAGGLVNRLTDLRRCEALMFRGGKIPWNKYEYTLEISQMWLVFKTPILDEYNLRWDGFGTVGLIGLGDYFCIKLAKFICRGLERKFGVGGMLLDASGK